MKVMSGLDARFLYSETPTAHMHTLKVVVVDLSGRREPVSAEQLPELIEQRLARMPVLRRRVIPIPHGLGNPVLVDDPDFDLSRHLRTVTAAPPGGQRELDMAIAEVAGGALPRDRPLWELTVIDGLAHGRVAFAMKLHHALADGMAAVALLQNAFVVDDDHAIVEPYQPEPLPGNADLYRASAASAAKAVRKAPGVLARTVSGSLNARAAKQIVTAPVTGPFKGPRTAFNIALTSDRTFAGLDIPLEKVLRAKEVAGVSFNDIFLALCGGATRRYLLRIGDLPERGLTASVPMATRTHRHRLGGNHVDNLFVPLYTDMTDLIERARAINKSSVAARQVRSEFGPDLFEQRSGLVPAPLHGVLPRVWGLTRLADHLRPPLNLIASCVRGPSEPLQVDGATVSSLFSSGPILEGIGLNITAWTYMESMYVSILGCSASLPNPWLLAQDFEAELADVPSTGD